MANGALLIVDDDPQMRMLLSARVRQHGFTCVFAADCYQAISMARQHQPRAILLDLHMPAGDGFLVLQRLKSLPALSTIPVVVISSDDRTRAEAPALEAGAVAYLEKPIQNDSLEAALTVALGNLN